MKIGVFNRHWNTSGGGEKHIGKVVEILSKTYEVDLICTEPIDFDALKRILNIDFSKVHIVMWPNMPCRHLSYFTQKYDLFINASFGSDLVSLARFSS